MIPLARDPYQRLKSMKLLDETLHFYSTCRGRRAHLEAIKKSDESNWLSILLLLLLVSSSRNSPYRGEALIKSST